MWFPRGLGKGENGGDSLMDTGSPCRWWKCFRTRWSWWLHHIVNVLSATELYSSKWLISCYMNFISIKNKQTTKDSGKLNYLVFLFFTFSSVQSLSHVRHLWLHGLLHARLPCLSPTPGAYSDSSPSSWWCHPAISSSVTLFASCPQSFPASGCFPVSRLFASSGQSIGTAALVLPMEYSGWFPLWLTGLISLVSKGLSRIFPSPQFKSISSLVLSLLYGPALTSIHNYWKNNSFD